MRKMLFATTALVLAFSVPTLAAAQQDKAQGQQTQQTQQGASSQNQQQAQVPQEAKQFAEFAALDGMFEVQAGEMAQDKAQDQKVKEFAQTLVKDHKAANDKLKSIAQDKGMQLPQSLDQEHQQKLDKLKQASAQEFDRQFVEMNVKGHEQAVQKFESYAKDGKVEELKSFASDTAPKLKEHLKTAQDLQSDLQKTASASGQSQQGQSQQKEQQQANMGGGQSQGAQVTVVPPPQQDRQDQANVTVVEPKQDRQDQANVTVVEPKQDRQDQANVTIVEPKPKRDADVAVVRPEGEAVERENVTTVMPATGAVSLDKLIGRDVIGSDGEELGEIEDVILDAQTGEGRQVVLGSGGFLGIGEKRIALDMQDIEIGEDRIVAGGLTQASVEAMEEYQENESAVSLRRRGAAEPDVTTVKPVEPRQ